MTQPSKPQSQSELRIVAIAAVSENGVIGSGDDMLWHLPKDFARFKAVTTGNTLLFGRKTHEQIGRTLPNRRIIVITRQEDWSEEGVEVAHSVTEALDMAAETPDKICYVGGGSQIYAEAWPYLTELDITQVHGEYEGEATFPVITPAEWVEVSREQHEEFDFVQYRPSPAVARKRDSK